MKLDNGLGIPITDIGNVRFTLPHTNIVVPLHQLLHVSIITRNLMSLSKFERIMMCFLNFMLIHILSNLKLPNRFYFMDLEMIFVFFPHFIHISPHLLIMLMFLLIRIWYACFGHAFAL